MSEQEFKVGEDEKPVDVEINEDGSEAKIVNEAKPEPEVAVVDKKESSGEKQDEELEDYSDKVQKRINKMTARLREAERQKEAALQYAQNVQAEQEVLKKKFNTVDEQRIVETKNRTETQVAALKQVIKKAREEEDIDTETEAQEKLAGVLYEQRDAARSIQQKQEENKQPAPQQVQQPQQPRLDPKAEKWAEENSWFGEVMPMTYFAQGLHRQLVSTEGFDPTSNEYYDELNKRLRSTFPTKFDQTTNSGNRPVQSVAPATRSSGVNSVRRKVNLTPSQVAIAKKLGVPIQEYAKYVK